MKTSKDEQVAAISIPARADVLFEQQKKAIAMRTDKLFAWLFILQWIGAIVWTLVATPLSWEGTRATVHIHVWQSTILGAVILSLPLFFIFKNPGTELTRQVVAIAQILWSGLLIAASGGRIETHFHVFGSLALLTFYRDWRTLVTASAVTTVDHLLRGIYLPDTIYGVSYAEPWRWVEHAAWVLFCDVFLIYSIQSSLKDMRGMALRQAELEASKNSIEQEVIARTAELKDSELNLRESEAKIRAIFETAADSIVTVSENGSIEAANQTCEQMFAYHFHQFFGKHISFLIKNVDEELCTEDSWMRLFGDCAISQEALRLEGVGESRTRGLFPIEISLSYVESKGKKLITAIIRDISERKEAEKRVSEFYSIVSHELRTPLTSIRGSLGLVEGGMTGELTAETTELVGIARESCDRLIRLINDILDLKKLETGKFEFHKREFSPADLIAMAVSYTQGMANDRSIRLDIGAASNQSILADSDRLNQVLVNLVSNAIKFSPKNGVVELSATAGDGMVRFAVRDQGKGIAEDQQYKLFKKFQQVDSSDKREQEGTGLGLAICKAIVEQHGGTIGVDSAENEGATFWFKVPVGVNISRPVESGSSLVILVVEDDYSTRRTIVHQLEAHGFRCIEAEDGQHALALVSTESPQLIVLDVGLPEMDGFQFVQQLKSKQGGLTPLLVYTGRDLSYDERNMLTNGATRYLTKSKASQEELLNAVNDLLGRKQEI